MFKIKNRPYVPIIKKGKRKREREREKERERERERRWRARSHITRHNVSMSECIFHRSVRVGIFHCSAIDARTIHQSYGDAGYALRSVHTWKCVCAIRMNATFVYVHLSRAVNERWDTYCIRNVRLDNWFHRFAEVAAHSKILIQDIRHPQFSAINTRFSLSLSLSLSLSPFLPFSFDSI